MDISIRTATMTDAAAIAALSSQLGYPLSEEAAAHHLTMLTDREGEVVYVAILGTLVVGWLQLSFMMRLESGPFFEITGLVVDEQYRSCGIGKQLLNQVKEYCTQNGDHAIRVRSNVKRAAAHRFYLNNGFAEKKEQKVFELKAGPAT